MAKLTPDATRTEHGLVINEKIIPWGAVWPKDSGAYKKGAQYKADRLLSGGTGKVKGVTIHNTNDLKNVEEDAEQYGAISRKLRKRDRRALVSTRRESIGTGSSWSRRSAASTSRRCGISEYLTRCGNIRSAR